MSRFIGDPNGFQVLAPLPMAPHAPFPVRQAIRQNGPTPMAVHGSVPAHHPPSSAVLFDGHNISIVSGPHSPQFLRSKHSPIPSSVKTNQSPSTKKKAALEGSPNRYKTELCREWTQNGWCYYGERCSFAHGIAELRPVFRSKKWRTKRCRNWHKNGHCPYEHRCQFLHGEASMLEGNEAPQRGSVDLRSPPSMYHRKPPRRMPPAGPPCTEKNISPHISPCETRSTVTPRAMHSPIRFPVSPTHGFESGTHNQVASENQEGSLDANFRIFLSAVFQNPHLAAKTLFQMGLESEKSQKAAKKEEKSEKEPIPDLDAIPLMDVPWSLQFGLPSPSPPPAAMLSPPFPPLVPPLPDKQGQALSRPVPSVPLLSSSWILSPPPPMFLADAVNQTKVCGGRYPLYNPRKPAN